MLVPKSHEPCCKFSVVTILDSAGISRTLPSLQKALVVRSWLTMATTCPLCTDVFKSRRWHIHHNFSYQCPAPACCPLSRQQSEFHAQCSHQPEKMNPKDQVESWLQQTQDPWEEIAMIFYNLSDVLNEQLALIVLLVIVGIPRRFSIRNPSYLCRLRTPSLLQCLFPVIFPSEVCLIMNWEGWLLTFRGPRCASG